MIAELKIDRFKVMGWVFALIGFLILVKIVILQNSVEAQTLTRGLDYSITGNQPQFPPRGIIYDRSGNVLAGNQMMYKLQVRLSKVTNADTIAKEVSKLTGVNYAALFELCSGMKNGVKFPASAEYIDLISFVMPEKITALRKLMKEAPFKDNKELDALTWGLVTQRTYPEGSLAGSLIGFTTFKDPLLPRGLQGVEGRYNEILIGEQRIVSNSRNPSLREDVVGISAPTALVLTIDRDIQVAVERIMTEAVAKYKAASGTVIVTDPRTGEILALATTPKYDPNRYDEKQYPDNTPFNRALTVVYEPGSTFKIFTMATAMDMGKVTPERTIAVPAVINVAGQNIYNWDRAGHGNQSMTDCMANSLNVCLVWVEQQVGPTNYYAYMKKFGFDRLTNIDLMGEIALPYLEQGDNGWQEYTIASQSFGQAISVTPIQLVQAASALANNGQMMVPHVMKSYVQNGQVTQYTPQVAGTPIKAATAKTLTEMLATSVERETKLAKVEGYRVAGKTGTAEIYVPGKGYTSDLTNASFIGWGPADDPQLLIYVWLEEPRASKWGSETAAPTFAELFKTVAGLRNLPPDNVRKKLFGQ